ncbi:MAG: helix-turn-helix domain-containing protein [Caulobacteraceae bacterium]
MANKDDVDPIDIAVGATLRRLRQERDLSQQALGKTLGMSQQQVQKYERGINRISASMLVRAAQVLDVQPSDLLPRTNAPVNGGYDTKLAIPGAQELLDGYAAIKVVQQRSAVLTMVRSLQDPDPLRLNGDKG